MRIGLLTYHFSMNIGAMMQTYATCRALKDLGHEVLIVDIRQPEEIHSGITNLIVKAVYAKRDCELRRFRKLFYPPLTRRYMSLEELRRDPPEVDCLLVGSDQTWNPGISGDSALAYFLSFGPEDVRRVSYASSFGISSWPEDSPLTDEVRAALNRFDHISVRETSGVSLLSDAFGLKVVQVCDPTLLFDGYDEITGTVGESGELVVYKLDRTPEFYAGIGAVKRMAGMPARLLNNSFPVKGLRYTYPPGVREWICRLGGACMVLTDSFHGVAFSLLYRRNFVVVLNRNGKESRILDLLESVGLRGRAFDSMSDLAKDRSWLEPIDYKTVEPRLLAIREASWTYLREALD